MASIMEGSHCLPSSWAFFCWLLFPRTIHCLRPVELPANWPYIGGTAGNTKDPGTCKYTGERRNVIFMCSATKIGPNRFRLFFGGGDGNVGTGVVEVHDL